ncbi:MAG: BtpA/SgcQ family protein [Erysipelotrichaceae bacterium]
MNWLNEMFRCDKVVIGLLHLDELPGDPFFDEKTSMKDIIKHAAEDLNALQKGGVDAILITNEFSLPYQRKVSQVTTNAMALVVGALLKDIKVPFGVEAIYDGDATIELCAACNAQFTRCLFTGAWAGDFGLIDRDIAHTIRLKHSLRQDDLKLLYFVNSEDEVYVNNRTLGEITKSLNNNCHPDAFVVAGSNAGKGPAMESILEVKEQANHTPVFCGTGCKIDNVEAIFDECDGAFVGTTFKKDGKSRERIDEKRVRAFMEVVKQYRKV